MTTRRRRDLETRAVTQSRVNDRIFKPAGLQYEWLRSAGADSGCEGESHFMRWFAGSRVVDRRGQPLVQYHLTRAVFADFRPLSHFGTLRAASLRALHYGTPEQQKRRAVSEIADVHIHPVYLQIRQPLAIYDRNINHKAKGYLEEMQWIFGAPEWGGHENMVHAHLFAAWTDFEMSDRDAADYEADVYNPYLSCVPYEDVKAELAQGGLYPVSGDMRTDRDNLCQQRMILQLEEYGFDGFVYQNKIEDRLSLSWVPFRAEQIFPALWVRKHAAPPAPSL